MVKKIRTVVASGREDRLEKIHERKFYILSGVAVTQMCIVVKTCHTVHSKSVYYIICKLNLNKY